MKGSKYDVAIVGCGILGLETAKALANKYRIIALEKDRLGDGASGNNLRIIHSGFRYIKSLNLLRTIRSIRAGRIFRHAYPEFVQKMDCYLPYRKGLIRDTFFKCGALTYNLTLLLTGYKGKEAWIVVSCDGVPSILRSGKHFLKWRDLMLTDPKALLNHIATQLIKNGATLRTQAQVTEIVKRRDNSYPYKVVYRCKDDGGINFINCKTVIDTSGIGYEAISYSGIKSPRMDGWVYAFNVIIDNLTLLPPNTGIGIYSDFFKRHHFLVSRESGTAIGTGYIRREEVNESILKDYTDKLLNETVYKLNPCCHSERDLKTTLEGAFLPLKPRKYRGLTGIKLLDHDMIYQDQGYIFCIPAKLTTACLTAKTLARRIEPFLRTDK